MLVPVWRVSFFFDRCADRRDLHSFPTRRSSDLGGAAAAAGDAGGRRPFSRPARSWSRARTPRSEEHTSELQSRENLVCRLLLEKKNSSRPSTGVARLPSPETRASGGRLRYLGRP